MTTASTQQVSPVNTPEPAGQRPGAPRAVRGDEGKWPAWRVTTLVLTFCAAVWGGVIYLIVAIF